MQFRIEAEDWARDLVENRWQMPRSFEAIPSEIQKAVEAAYLEGICKGYDLGLTHGRRQALGQYDDDDDDIQR